jgi:hypothetical protein
MEENHEWRVFTYLGGDRSWIAQERQKENWRQLVSKMQLGPYPPPQQIAFNGDLYDHYEFTRTRTMDRYPDGIDLQPFVSIDWDLPRRDHAS